VSGRAEARRAARDANRASTAERACDDQIPVVPGVIRDHSSAALAEALAEAHDSLPDIPGTRVEVVTYERGDGLRWVERMWGLPAAVLIAARLDMEGPESLVVLAMRVPFTWHRTAAGEFCCTDPTCPARTLEDRA
jgi:hypothetical protein